MWQISELEKEQCYRAEGWGVAGEADEQTLDVLDGSNASS